MDPRQARIVELRYFGGLPNEEVAEVLGISDRTVKREWSLARAWLMEQLEPSGRESGGAVRLDGAHGPSKQAARSQEK